MTAIVLIGLTWFFFIPPSGDEINWRIYIYTYVHTALMEIIALPLEFPYEHLDICPCIRIHAPWERNI